MLQTPPPSAAQNRGTATSRAAAQFAVLRAAFGTSENHQTATWRATHKAADTIGQVKVCPCQLGKFTCPVHHIHKPSVSVAKVPACAVQGDFSTQFTMTVQLSGRACTAKQGRQAVQPSGA